jgi:hypothetical protein
VPVLYDMDFVQGGPGRRVPREPGAPRARDHGARRWQGGVPHVRRLRCRAPRGGSTAAEPGETCSARRRATRSVSMAPGRARRRSARATAGRWRSRPWRRCSLRNMVEELRRVGANHAVQRLSLFGSLPLDDTALSVRTPEAPKWLDDRVTYLEAFPHTEFPVDVEPTDEGANLRVELGDPRHPGAATGARGAQRLVAQLHPQLRVRGRAGGHREHLEDAAGLRLEPRRVPGALLRAPLQARAPARALLENLLLIRFHQTVAPIARVTMHL